MSRLVNARQIRAARGLLLWSQTKLAKNAGLSMNSVAKFERGEVNTTMGTLVSLIDTLEAAGIEFWNEKDGSYGVMYRPPQNLADKNNPPQNQ